MRGLASEPVQVPWKSPWPVSATGQGGEPAFPLRLRPRLRRTVSNSRGCVEWKSTASSGGAGERVSAHVAVGRDLAGGQVELKFAQVDGAVALGVGCHRQCRWQGISPGRGWAERAEVERGGDGDGSVVAIGPEGGGGTVEEGTDSQALEGRLADHIEDSVKRDVIEGCSHFADDRNGDRRRVEGAGESFALAGRAAMRLEGRCTAGPITAVPAMGGSQWAEVDLALHLAALAQAGNDAGDEQAFRVGVDMAHRRRCRWRQRRCRCRSRCRYGRCHRCGTGQLSLLRRGRGGRCLPGQRDSRGPGSRSRMSRSPAGPWLASEAE